MNWVKFLCLFIPLKKWRKAVRAYFNSYKRYRFKNKDIEKLKINEKFYPNNIFSVEKTINLIIEKRLSCSRIGDGEFLVMMGKHNVYKNNSKDLQNKLLDICKKGSNDKCLVCINPYHLYNTTNRWFVWYYSKCIEQIKEKIKFNFNDYYGDAYCFF